MIFDYWSMVLGPRTRTRSTVDVFKEMRATMDGKIAILVAEAFQDEEVAEPKSFFEDHGYTVELIGIDLKEYYGKYHRQSFTSDKTFANADPSEYLALIIPGGSAPEHLRIENSVIAFVKAFMALGRPIGAICHGPQVLISAGLLKGRHVTSYIGIRDDVRLAGAEYDDSEVVIDGNLVTSRKPADIPAFDKAILELLASQASFVADS